MGWRRPQCRHDLGAAKRTFREVVGEIDSDAAPPGEPGELSSARATASINSDRLGVVGHVDVASRITWGNRASDPGASPGRTRRRSNNRLGRTACCRCRTLPQAHRSSATRRERPWHRSPWAHREAARRSETPVRPVWRRQGSSLLPTRSLLLARARGPHDRSPGSDVSSWTRPHPIVQASSGNRFSPSHRCHTAMRNAQCESIAQ